MTEWTRESIDAEKAALRARVDKSVADLDPTAFLTAERERRDFETLMVYGADLAGRPDALMLWRRAAEDRAMYESAYMLWRTRCLIDHAGEPTS